MPTAALYLLFATICLNLETNGRLFTKEPLLPTKKETDSSSELAQSRNYLKSLRAKV